MFIRAKHKPETKNCCRFLGTTGTFTLGEIKIVIIN